MTKLQKIIKNKIINKHTQSQIKKYQDQLEELSQLHMSKLQLEIEERKRAEEIKSEALNETRILQKEIMHIAEKERQRIGQDLHDGIGQNLTAVTFLIEALREKMKNYAGDMISDIDEIDNLVRKSIIQTRSIAKVLSPVEMDKNGLYSALGEMASTIEKVFDVTCEISRRGNFYIEDNQTAIHLYYITREAVTNAVKHGRAKNVHVCLTSEDSILKLIILDDGMGCKEYEMGSGMGLRIMKYRASMIGGEFFAKNRSKKGFEVKVVLKAATPVSSVTVQ
jgi:two-component system, LuxR family, sensor kinase FixL